MLEETSIKLAGDFSSPLAATMREAFDRAQALESKLPQWILDLHGMSGRNYRRFVNNLIEALDRPHYLEVGSWRGSTACAAMYGNSAAITCIDNWSEFSGPREAFVEHIQRATSAETRFALLDEDFRQTDFSAIEPADVYLFDGPHEKQDQIDGIVCAAPALASNYVQIVDDWNWARVREGTMEGIERSGGKLIASVEIQTTQNGEVPSTARCEESAWHNGCFMGVVERS